MNLSKILIVDDDRVSSVALSKRLQKRGFDTVTCGTGQKCLEIIDNESFDIILLDQMMPGLSGNETLEKIRESYDRIHLPVMMVTGLDKASDIVTSFKIGANDYITKPINIDAAEARIKTLIELKNLHKQNIKSKETETLNAMITTYNHEINNPLTVALAGVKLLKEKKDFSYIEKTEKALERIAQIVRSIQDLTFKQAETTEYAEQSKMYKIND